MWSKVILAPILILLLGSSIAWGQSNFSCPPISNDYKGEHIPGWIVKISKGTVPLPKGQTWYAYDAWILVKGGDYPQNQIQCNYVNATAGDPNFTAQAVIMKTVQDPKSYVFNDVTFSKGKAIPGKYTTYKNEPKLIAWECSPWKIGKKSIPNTFPIQCNFRQLIL
ncbi:MAG: hypothetical protein K2P93_05340 [Alphaproteobacteria bacterium]|nr:hypothetical protein [Alphaproteobacteria bacterium]